MVAFIICGTRKYSQMYFNFLTQVSCLCESTVFNIIILRENMWKKF